MENTTTYHEIDFLLPAQRFNINFLYITKKGLPFVREFILRLVHLAPMSSSQIAIFFGFSLKEVDVAIADLIERDELTLAENGRLMITEKSIGYFTEIGEIPRLSALQESSACLSFDMATFTCLGKGIAPDKWKAGIHLGIDGESLSRSEVSVEKHFQHQFNEILRKGFLSKSLVQDVNDTPTVYTVNSVDKLKQFPLRLTVRFQVGIDGKSVEREDFEILNSSDYVHERIAVEIKRMARPSNALNIAKAMVEFDDCETLKLFDSKTSSINLQFLEDITKLETNSQERRTFLGPIYLASNWEMLQKRLAPILKSRIEGKADVGKDSFLWLAPSDPYWSKSNQLLVSLSEFLNQASTKDKKLYSPSIYLPVSGKEDQRTNKIWKKALAPYTSTAHGVIEGFLGGDVEVMHFEGELAVVVYHMSIPDTYPITLPLGFISTEEKTVRVIGRLVKAYLQGSSGFDRPNDLGVL